MDIDDPTLIAFLKVTPPRELTQAQIMHIRDRLVHSSEFRRQWLAEKEWENYFREALLRVDLSLDHILKEADEAPKKLKNSIAPNFLATFLAVGLFAIGAWFTFNNLKDKPVEEEGEETAVLTQEPSPELSNELKEDSNLSSEVVNSEQEAKSPEKTLPNENTEPHVEQSDLKENSNSPTEKVEVIQRVIVDGNDDPAAEKNVLTVFEDKDHPLRIELNKEGYNLWVELTLALEERAWTDVLQTLREIPPTTSLGLWPDTIDRDLLVPYSTAIALAMKDHPDLLSKMRTEFGPLAFLRLKKATEAGDENAIRAVSTQFFGTEAASQAHRWLGDRALSDGEFFQALENYKQALSNVTHKDHAKLKARIRLTGAMVGLDLGEAIADSIQLGKTKLSKAEFEQLVTERRTAAIEHGNEGRSVRSQLTIEIDLNLPPAPRPQQFKTQSFTKVSEPSPNDPSPQLKFASIAKEASATSDGQSLFLSNQLELGAIDLQSGKLKWVESFIENQAEGVEWNYVPVPPFISGSRLYTRLLPKQGGPELVCLDSETGKILWNSRPGQYVASPPLWNHDKLLALIAVETNTEIIVRGKNQKNPSIERAPAFNIELASFDPFTGKTLSKKHLLQLHDRWSGKMPSSAIIKGNRIIAFVGGVVFCIDTEGKFIWLRKLPWSKAAEGKTQQKLQAQSHPLIFEERVILPIPEKTAIQCLSIATGRVLWNRPLEKFNRILGIVDQRVIVVVENQLQGLDTRSGQIKWTHELKGKKNRFLCGGPGKLAYYEIQSQESKSGSLTIVWLNPESGHVTARHPLNGIESTEYGRWITAQGRQFLSIIPEDSRATKRGLIELVPADKPATQGQ